MREKFEKWFKDESGYYDDDNFEEIYLKEDDSYEEPFVDCAYKAFKVGFVK